MLESNCKICVVGPCKVGKTLVSRLLAQQPLFPDDYYPTAATRVQEFSRNMGVGQMVKVQLWDCSGNLQYQTFWSALCKEVDGVLLVVDSNRPEQAKELEQYYTGFVQSNNLTTRQCMVLGVNFSSGGTSPSNWTGVPGKLGKLQSAYLPVDLAATSPAAEEAGTILDKLLVGCLAQKREQLERAIMAD